MLGNLMRETLKKQNITITKAAEMMGISQPRLNLWLSGKNEPSQENIKKFCDLFHVTPNYLFGFDDEITEQDKQLLKAFKAIASNTQNGSKAENTTAQKQLPEKER